MTDADAELVLAKLAEYGNLSKACRETNLSKFSFLRWCDVSPDNAHRYTRARESGLDAEADRAIDEAIDAKDAALGRLALDARKWYLSKLMPKKYGDKLAVGGADDLPAIKTDDVSVTVAKLVKHGMTEEAALRLIAEGDDK